MLVHTQTSVRANTPTKLAGVPFDLAEYGAPR